MFLKQKGHCDQDLGPRTLILKLDRDIVILNGCVELDQNQSINVGARIVTVFFFFFK